MRYAAELPDITYPLRIDTIGKQIALGYEVHASCEKCRHSGRLNLVRLAYKLGYDHGCLAPEIKPHVKCAKCLRMQLLAAAEEARRKCAFSGQPTVSVRGLGFAKPPVEWLL
jgi:hypothetical protein